MSLAPVRGRAGRELVIATLLPLLSAVIVLAAWQVFVTMARVPAVILPPPTAIAWQFAASLPELLRQAAVTGRESLEAFVMATAIGAAIAVVISFSTVAREAIYPNLVVLQLIPRIALAPLFVIWLGVGAPSHLAFGVFVSFFPITLSAATGPRQH